MPEESYVKAVERMSESSKNIEAGASDGLTYFIRIARPCL